MLFGNLKRNKIHTTTRVALKNTILCERVNIQKIHILYKIIYMKCPAKVRLQRQEGTQHLPGAGAGNGV